MVCIKIAPMGAQEYACSLITQTAGHPVVKLACNFRTPMRSVGHG